MNESARMAVATRYLGMRVDRGPIAATLWGDHSPSAEFPIYNVVGGRVQINEFVMEITTALSANACQILFQFTPTGGSAVGLTAACATLSGKAVGTRFLIAGSIGGALTFGSIGASMKCLASPWILGQAGPTGVGVGGVLASLASAATLTSGAAKFSIWYAPIDAGASIVAA